MDSKDTDVKQIETKEELWAEILDMLGQIADVFWEMYY
jgi:hypothetical protein